MALEYNRIFLQFKLFIEHSISLVEIITCLTKWIQNGNAWILKKSAYQLLTRPYHYHAHGPANFSVFFIVNINTAMHIDADLSPRNIM